LRLGARVSVTPSVWEDDVAEAIDALSDPVVMLSGGASLSIWPTPALVAIDVDAGGALTGAGGARSRHEALNRAVVPALAEQIRLRNLSGGIVVDLAGLSPRKRAGLAPDFVTALANDPLRPRFLGFTALGLAEIVRSRVHPPLHELLAGPLAAGLMALRAVMAAFERDPRGMPAVRAHPAVVSALQGDSAALADLARRTGRGVTLRSDPSLPATAWVLERDHG
jgi:ribonuclease G